MEAPNRDSGVTPEQVGNLLRDLTKAVRAHHLYREDNPSYRRMLSELRDGFASLWDGLDQLELLVSEERLAWNGTPVYESGDRAESFAFLLHKDGVRGLRFLRGFEEDDLDGFLDALEQVRYARAEGDDLVTLLWERNLPCLHYSAAELLTRGVEVPEPPADPAFDLLEVRRMALEEEREGEEVGTGRGAGEADGVAELDWAEGGSTSQKMHASLHVLQETERAELEDELELERTRALRRDVAAALVDCLESEEGEERRHALRCVEGILDDFLAADDLEGALELLTEAGELVDGEGEKGTEPMVSRMSEDDAVGSLVGLLTRNEPGSREIFRRFVPFLSGPALPHLYRHAAECTEEPVGEELRRAVVEVASGSPEAVPAALDSSEPEVLAAAAGTMAELGITGSSDRLAPLLDHPGQPVRLAAVRALAIDPDAGAHLEKALDDADTQVRMSAVEGIAGQGYRPATAALESAARGRSFQARGLTEMRAFLGAYAALAGNGAVGLLGELLNARGLLGASHSAELRACAARALGLVGTEAARRELSRAAGDKDTLVRHAVEHAQRGDEPG